MLRNKISTTILSVLTGVALTAVLIISVPLISGSMQEDELKPMIMVSSIDFYKKTILIKKKKEKKKPKKLKKIKKKPKKITKKIKKTEAKVVKKKQIVKPIDELFASKNKIIKKISKIQENEIPVHEPIYRLSERPYFLHKPDFSFPADMRKLGKSAIVILDALIDRKGRVRKVTIFKSAGKSFDQAAINAINGSIFVPGKINGKAVATLYRTDIKFTLK